jgi:predicted alpha/beta hydrolase
MTSTPLQLQTADGCRLAATHFSAPGDQFMVMAGATAVPRGFYKRFAEFAQARGVNVITTDYRGSGESRTGPLKGFEMEYADWSRYDLAAAVNYAAQRGRVWLVGHSLGGHAIGQLPEPNVLQAAYVCGTGAGWHGWMPRPERYRAWAMWNLIGPITTRIYGYHPMSKFGMGEDLPMGVYRDWKRWCANPHYFFDDPEARAITEKFAQVRIPLAAAVSTDDLWAPPASRDAFFKGYSGAAVQRIDFKPAELGVEQVGHMGYFRAQAGAVLWPQILAWLAQHGLRAGA